MHNITIPKELDDHLIKTSYVNTMDTYTGEWVSSPIFGNMIINTDLLVSSLSKQYIDLYGSILDIYEMTNLVGVEYNYVKNLDAPEHVDNVNTHIPRLRVLVHQYGDLLEIKSLDKTMILSKDNKSISFICSDPHSAKHLNPNNSTSFLIFDYFIEDVDPVSELGYLISPLYYYIRKRYDSA